MNNYTAEKYDNAERLDVYKTQIRLIEKQKFETIIEFGIGSGFLKRYLQSKGKQIKSVDVNGKLNPDIISKIQDYKSKDKYDLALCLQVLEYVRENELNDVMRMLKKSGQTIIISIPIQTWYLKFSLKIPFTRINIEKVWCKEKQKNCVPYRKWMLGDSKHSVKWFTQLLINNSLEIKKQGCFFPDALHYYFVCKELKK